MILLNNHLAPDQSGGFPPLFIHESYKIGIGLSRNKIKITVHKFVS